MHPCTTAATLQRVITSTTAAQHKQIAPLENVLVLFASALLTVTAPLETAFTAADTPNWLCPSTLLMAAAMAVIAAYLRRASFPKYVSLTVRLF
jgi:hypothetical protein